MPDGARPGPGDWIRFVLEVTDLAGTVARPREAGARLRNDTVAGPGGRRTLVEYPFGNLVELFQPA